MPRRCPVLWHLEISHYNEKARWALDYKGVPHLRRAVTPGLQELTARRLRAGRTVPILQLDGRAIGDSTRIIEEIERRWPQPPLYPSDPEERQPGARARGVLRRALRARRAPPAVRSDNLDEPEKFLGMFARPRPPATRAVQGPEPGPGGRREAALRDPAGPRRELARGGPDSSAHVEAEAGERGYLVGDSFTVADLTAASILCRDRRAARVPLHQAFPGRARRAVPGISRLGAGPARVQSGSRSMYARHRGTSAEVVRSSPWLTTTRTGVCSGSWGSDSRSRAR